ncbi:MAG: hypothetical protein V4463_10010 [Pseudomonadota bacterium]
MKTFVKLQCAALAFALAGCAGISVVKVDSGERLVGERLTVTLDGAWNHVSSKWMNGPHAQTWTMDGLPLDQMLIYSGLQNDEAVHADLNDSGKKAFKFRADMQPDQIVALFEGMLTRDGSTFKLKQLSPAPFAGAKGFRFQYTLTRKSDNLELTGIGGGGVDKGALYAIVYQAPKLMVTAKEQQRVNKIIDSARVKG